MTYYIVLNCIKIIFNIFFLMLVQQNEWLSYVFKILARDSGKFSRALINLAVLKAIKKNHIFIYTPLMEWPTL